METPRTLSHLLWRAALGSPERSITFLEKQGKVQRSLSYKSLLEQSQAKAKLLHQIPGITKNKIVLLHFDKLEQSIEWFWATVIAGYLPALSPPFSNYPAQHAKHLAHLKTILNDPIVLTSNNLVDCFDGHRLNVNDVQTLQSRQKLTEDTAMKDVEPRINGTYAERARDQEHAVLMLTSGSTGSAKAVALKHKQVIAAVAGKSATMSTSKDDVFLNWIGLDHVAGLVETHLQAIYVSASQVHIDAAEVVADPLLFLRVISKFGVSFTFAPNFFLAKLERALDGVHVADVDLSRLRIIISGGEANSVSTAVKLLHSLAKYGAPKNLIRPGFGMTETCAGSIYSHDFPEYEIKKNLNFGSLGKCIPGINMRVRLDDGTYASQGSGKLQISGPVVFSEYLNNPVATAEAFSEDGWFSTDDLATLDEQGMLHLTGRIKDVVNLNGVKYNLEDIETAIEETRIEGVAPSFTKAFAVREDNAETESLVVIYMASFNPSDDEGRARARRGIDRVCQLQCGAKPLDALPLPSAALEKSSLGKLSRAKLRASYLNGEYKTQQRENDLAYKRFEDATFKTPSTDAEEIIRSLIGDLMDCDAAELSVSSGLMDFGVSSVEVIKFKKLLQEKFKIADVPMIAILTNVSIESLAKAIEELAKPRPYDPVVILNTEGTKLPLWLVHPGAGEVLVYLNLAKQINDRPLYALRARGFDNDEPLFTSIPELINTYCAHIKRVQPEGPYAILGYSFGSMFAAEISKELIRRDEKVMFTGVLNLPPHVQYRIRQLNMHTAILTLGLFLDLIQDDDPETFYPGIMNLSYDELLEEILRRSGTEKLDEAGLDREKFMTWARVTNSLHAIAWDYVPEGSLPGVDVWVAHPLKAVARNKEEWFSQQLIKWNDFSDTPTRFHPAVGEHFTMINAENTPSFAKTLKAALHARGI